MPEEAETLLSPKPEKEEGVAQEEVEPGKGGEVVVEPEPISPTIKKMIEQAAEGTFQRVASWQGQREKGLFDALGNLIDSRLSNISTSPSPSSPETLATIDEDPEAWARTVVPRIFDEEINKRTQAEQKFNADIIQHAAAVMDADPLFADKDLGNEVVSEIQKNFGTVNKQLPPDAAAQLLVNTALTGVIRKKMLEKINPLAKNRPATDPLKTITAPITPASKPKGIKLSKEAQKLKERFGYSDDDIARVFGGD